MYAAHTLNSVKPQFYFSFIQLWQFNNLSKRIVVNLLPNHYRKPGSPSQVQAELNVA